MNKEKGRRLQAWIPPEFALGVHCSVGAILQVPLTIEASGLTICSVFAHADQDAIKRIDKQVVLEPERSTILNLALEATNHTTGRTHVSIEVLGDDTIPRVIQFPIEVADSG